MDGACGGIGLCGKDDKAVPVLIVSVKTGEKKDMAIRRPEKIFIFLFRPFIEAGCGYDASSLLYALPEGFLFKSSFAAGVENDSFITVGRESPGKFPGGQLIALLTAGKDNRGFGRRINVPLFAGSKKCIVYLADQFFNFFCGFVIDIVSSTHSLFSVF